MGKEFRFPDAESLLAKFLLLYQHVVTGEKIEIRNQRCVWVIPTVLPTHSKKSGKFLGFYFNRRAKTGAGTTLMFFYHIGFYDGNTRPVVCPAPSSLDRPADRRRHDIDRLERLEDRITSAIANMAQLDLFLV